MAGIVRCLTAAALLIKLLQVTDGVGASIFQIFCVLDCSLMNEA